MPTIIDRETGEPIMALQLTKDEKEMFWEAFVRAYIRKHPELFNGGEQADTHVTNCPRIGTRSEGVLVKTEKKTYSVAEAAKVLGISAKSMYDLARTKGFPTIQVGKRLLISIKGLEKWIEEQSQRGWGGTYVER